MKMVSIIFCFNPLNMGDATGNATNAAADEDGEHLFKFNL